MAKIKMTLSTGKIVVLKELEVGDQELAVEATGIRDAGNTVNLGMKAQNELVKLLLVSIDGKVLKGNEKESLKSLFSYKEYAQVLKQVETMGGTGEDEKKPIVEILPE